MDSFKGMGSLADLAKPKLSKLEQEKQDAIEKQKKEEEQDKTKETEASKKSKQGAAWMAMSFDEAFGSVKPRKSRLEQEKERATLEAQRAKEEAQKAADQPQVVQAAPKKVLASTEEPFWGNVIKKRSRLEIEKERAKAAFAKDQDADDEIVKESHAMTKRRKIEEANNYWKQFGNGDPFTQAIKKKSKLE